MARLYDKIKGAVENDRLLISWHADEKCEERGITAWQVVAGFAQADVVKDRPRSKPNPSVVLNQILEDGSEIIAIGPGSPRRDGLNL